MQADSLGRQKKEMTQKRFEPNNYANYSNDRWKKSYPDYPSKFQQVENEATGQPQPKKLENNYNQKPSEIQKREKEEREARVAAI